jgi:hypothetical protein
LDCQFSFVNSEDQLKTVKALIAGNSLTAGVVLPYGMLEMQPLPIKIDENLQ